MEYFKLFEIPVALQVDTTGLRKRFIELSRRFHPDYHAQAGADAQADALDQSAMLNKAWKILQDKDAVVRYVLMEKNLMEPEEKYQLSPDFLMEMMEINEQVMDLDPGAGASEVEPLLSQITNLSTEIYAPVKSIVEGYQEGVTSEAELLRVKEWYYQKKYLDRIGRELAGKM